MKLKRDLFPHQFDFIAIIMFIFGLVSLIFSVLVGFIIITIAIILFFAYESLNIDFDKKRIKVAIGIFGFEFGLWKKLPQISHIEVIRKKKTGGSSYMGLASVSTVILVFTINFVLTDGRNLLIKKFSNRNKCMKAVEEIAINLDLNYEMI